MAGLYYEQFSVGMEFDHAIRRTITETDNVLFSTMTMNPQPLHLDAEFASKSEFGKVLVNSMFTLALLVGISVHETTMGTTIANLGFGDIAFPAPMFHGDTLRVVTTVISMRESKSRPEAGLIEFEHRGYNQHDVLTATCRRTAFMRRQTSLAGRN